MPSGRSEPDPGRHGAGAGFGVDGVRRIPGTSRRLAGRSGGALQWPRSFNAPDGTKIELYQPQIDTWTADRLTGRMAVAIGQAKRNPTYGVADFSARAEVNKSVGLVHLSDIRIERVQVPTGAGRAGVAWNNGNVYADHNGNVYEHNDNGWQQHTSSGWQPARRDTQASGSSCLNSQRQARDYSSRRAADFPGGGWQDRMDGGFAPSPRRALDWPILHFSGIPPWRCIAGSSIWSPSSASR